MQIYSIFNYTLLKLPFKIAFTGWDTANKYQVSNNGGQQVFYAMESEYTIWGIGYGKGYPSSN